MARFLLSCCLALLLMGGAMPAHGAWQQSASTSPDTSAAMHQWPESSILGDAFVHETGKQGLEHLYNMEFAKAEAHFQQISARYPNHPVAPFLKGLNIWWQIMLDLTDTSHDDAFYEAMDEVIARCDALLEETPDHFDATFFKGAAHGFKARLQSNRGNWFNAALDGKRAIGYVRDVAQRAPNNPDYGFGKGMYDYYAAIIPEQYPVSKGIMWMLPDGDKERGLTLLQRTAEEGWYVQTEAVYFLTQIYYLYENDREQALRSVRWLREAHPDNPFFHTFEGRVHARWGYWGEARRVFREVLTRHDADWAGYNAHMAEIARYYLARERITANAFDEALTHLAHLEALASRDEAKKNPYLTLSYLYQGMAFDALGKRDLAVHRYRLVLSMSDAQGAHDRAARYLDDPYDG